MSDVVWGYASHPDEETWSGSCSSREEAIAEGTETYEGEPFWICAGTRPDPTEMFTRADRLLEDANERAGDDAGDAAGEWPDLPRAKMSMFAAEYAALIRKWFPTCPFWILDGEKERIEPAMVSRGTDG